MPGFGPRIRRPVGAAVALWSLGTACSGGPDRSGGDGSGTSLPELTLKAQGDSLGPLAVTTPFDAGTLSGLFPGATVTERVGMSEGEAFPVYRVARNGDPVLDVRSRDGRTIQSVEVFAGAVGGPLTALLGRRFDRIFGGAEPPTCTAGMEEEAGRVLCAAPLSSKVTLVFAGSWEGPDGFAPPLEVVAGWTVERVLWRPRPDRP